MKNYLQMKSLYVYEEQCKSVVGRFLKRLFENLSWAQELKFTFGNLNLPPLNNSVSLAIYLCKTSSVVQWAACHHFRQVWPFLGVFWLQKFWRKVILWPARTCTLFLIQPCDSFPSCMLILIFLLSFLDILINWSHLSTPTLNFSCYCLFKSDSLLPFTKLMLSSRSQKNEFVLVWRQVATSACSVAMIRYEHIYPSLQTNLNPPPLCLCLSVSLCLKV